MLQHITIEIKDASQFESILRAALEREVHLVEYAILRTWDKLKEFEKQYGMSTAEFERRFTPDDLGETLEFIEWDGEIDTLRLLEEKQKMIKEARIK